MGIGLLQPAATAVVILVLSACATEAPTPTPVPVTPSPAPLEPLGGVVGQGNINGVRWLVTVGVRGPEVCFETSWPPAEGSSGGCGSGVDVNQGLLSDIGSAGRSGAPTVVHGTVGPGVASVRIEMLEGFGSATPVLIPALGNGRAAFASAFPDAWHLGTVFALDAQGNVVATAHVFP